MRDQWQMDGERYLNMTNSYFSQEKDAFFSTNLQDSYAIEKMLDAKYDKKNMKINVKSKVFEFGKKLQLKHYFKTWEIMWCNVLWVLAEGLYLEPEY